MSHKARGKLGTGLFGLERIPAKNTSHDSAAQSGLQKVWVFSFCDPGPGGPGRLPRAIRGAFHGPPGASRKPPRDLRQPIQKT